MSDFMAKKHKNRFSLGLSVRSDVFMTHTPTVYNLSVKGDICCVME